MEAREAAKMEALGLPPFDWEHHLSHVVPLMVGARERVCITLCSCEVGIKWEHGSELGVRVHCVWRLGLVQEAEKAALAAKTQVRKLELEALSLNR